MVYCVDKWLFDIGVNDSVGASGAGGASGASCFNDVGGGINTNNIHNDVDDREGYSLLNDGYRNGRILCDLCYLFDNDSWNDRRAIVYRNVNTIDKAIVNVCTALDVFNDWNRDRRIQKRLLVDPEGIIHGNCDIVYGLLWEIMQLYPLPVNIVYDQLHWGKIWKVKQWLKYTPLQRCRMCECLIAWLDDVGVLEKLGLGGRNGNDRHAHDYPTDYDITRDNVTGRIGNKALPNIYDLSNVLFDGTLLCVLCESILDGARLKELKGWSKVPKTKGLRFMNFNKVVKGLKGWYNNTTNVALSTRYFVHNVESILLNGSWSYMLGILEDLYRCYDGVKPKNGFRDVELPYYGKYCGVWGTGWEGLCKDILEEEKKVEREETEKRDLFCSEEREEKKVDFVKSDGIDLRNVLDGVVGTKDIVPVRIERIVEEKINEIVPSDDRRSGGHNMRRRIVTNNTENVIIDGNDLGPGVTNTVATPQAVVLEGDEADMFFEEAKRKNEESANEVDGVNMSMEEALGFEGGDVGGEEQEKNEDEEEEGVVDMAHEAAVGQQVAVAVAAAGPSRAEVFAVKKWLAVKLGIKLKDPACLFTPPFVSSEFTSGLMLLRISSELIPGRNEISGINWNPKTSAAKKSNCKRVVDALLSQFRPGKAQQVLSPQLRNCGEDIARGDGRIIISFLLGLKRLQQA